MADSSFIPAGLGWHRDLPDPRDYSPGHDAVADLLQSLKSQKTGLRRLERQELVRPLVVVEPDVFPQHPAQMPLVVHDHVIEAFAAERADHALGDAVRLGRADRRQHGPDADPGRLGDEVSAIARVAIPDPEAWRPTPGGGRDHLPLDPGRPGMRGHVPMLDPAPFMADHDEDVERPKRQRLHGEEVGGPDLGGVQVEKGAPLG